MMLAIIKQELFGMITIALPLIFLYRYFPKFLLSFRGIALCSLVTGAFLFFPIYYVSKKQFNGLKYSPTGECMKHFEDEVIKCGLASSQVQLKYGYTDNMIALNMLNTIVVDQMLWKNIENDPEAAKAKNVIESHVLPSLPSAKKTLLVKINELLTPQVQNFIFKHELGHIFYNHSIKKFLIIGISGACVTSAALLVASSAIVALGGMTALFLGLVAGASVDLLLTYANNLFFKVHSENNADLFAAQFCTQEEIEAAADFFEQYDVYAQECQIALGLPQLLSNEIFTGYPSGKRRAQYLRRSITSQLVS